MPKIYSGRDRKIPRTKTNSTNRCKSGTCLRSNTNLCCSQSKFQTRSIPRYLVATLLRIFSLERMRWEAHLQADLPSHTFCSYPNSIASHLDKLNRNLQRRAYWDKKSNMRCIEERLSEIRTSVSKKKDRDIGDAAANTTMKIFRLSNKIINK